ncbi:astacin (Peptidase family m12A) domain-containing protein [Ditylenchus destructor]|uniref:Metalloendopeptidase n=1 Tax=Ditylenchus destructor TaxID=166010 RepID=A0AAD4N3F1_9BILA|nr:astacin (Peptidase family m12A) domain-containing protein [Ditylenchus destructor]
MSFQLEHDRFVAQMREYDAFAEHFLLPQDFDLAEKTPVPRPTAEELEAVQNNELFEGDILGIAGANGVDPPEYRLEGDYQQLSVRNDANHKISDTLLSGEPYNQDDEGVEVDDGESVLERRSVHEELSSIFNRPYHSSLNTGTYTDKLWGKGKVPYMLEEGMTESQRAAIAQAFDEYKDKTCVRFVPRQESDHDYVYIKRNTGYGCSSYVGRAGGNQTVSLEIGKCFSKGIIAHELMHALGFFHEHSRTDRDQFVNIDEDNIRPGMMRNFEKYPKKIIDPMGMPYDYESVMHYHKLAFSKNGKPTIVPKDMHAEIGQRYKLSRVDAKKVNKLYQCDHNWELIRPRTTTTTTTTTTETSPSTTDSEYEIYTTPSTTSRTRTTSDRWPPPHRLITLSVFRYKTTTTTEAPTTTTIIPDGKEEEEYTTTKYGIRGKVVGETSDSELLSFSY